MPYLNNALHYIHFKFNWLTWHLYADNKLSITSNTLFSDIKYIKLASAFGIVFYDIRLIDITITCQQA